MKFNTLIPATIGRPRKDGGPPEGRWAVGGGGGG
jgi:hypothetical protein